MLDHQKQHKLPWDKQQLLYQRLIKRNALKKDKKRLKLMEKKAEKHEKIVGLRLKGKTLREIGIIMSLSTERIRQILVIHNIPDIYRAKRMKTFIERNCANKECNNIFKIEEDSPQKYCCKKCYAKTGFIFKTFGKHQKDLNKKERNEYSKILHSTPRYTKYRKQYYLKNKKRLLAYRNRPDVREKIRQYLKEYHKRPKIQEKRKLYQRKYCKIRKVKERHNEHVKKMI